MNSIFFLITDTEHKLYYVSEAATHLFAKPVNNILGSSWFSYISSSPALTKQLVLHDLSKQGFYNGYIRIENSPTLYFCDYGKRYNATGEHIGYEMVLTITNQEAADYISHFYQGIEQQIQQNPKTPVEQIYEQEKASIETNVGSEFSEFLLAIQDKYED